MTTATVVRTKGPKLALIAIIAVVIAGLSALDKFLAKAEQRELHRSARQFYINGSRLLKEGKPNEAVDLLRRAHALERQNAGYELKLIEGLMATGKIAEVEPLMREILEREPNDGRANLIAARLWVKKGNLTDAEAYYHRAIYGSWDDGSENLAEQARRKRVAARLELIDLLVAKGKKQELLAELLPLEEDAGNDIQIERKLARLFLVAGSAARAADVYHSLIQQEPRNPEAYAGLGEAELEQGQYHAAKTAFITAVLHEPKDASMRQQMQLASTMTALDPTPRQLPSIEKLKRSLYIVSLARASLARCIAAHPERISDESRAMLAKAENAMLSPIPQHVTNELAEEALGLAEKVWQARMKACGANPQAAEEPLRLIMEKLAQ